MSADYVLKTVAKDLVFPWSMAFLPNGEYLVVERSGSVRRVSPEGMVSAPLAGVPMAYVAGQGGFFDVLLDPDFLHNSLIYLSFASGTSSANATTIVRGKLTDDALVEQRRIFQVSPAKDTPVHYGGRMALLPDRSLLLTTGDGFDYREAAQDVASELGKVIRIDLDGKAPADNPMGAGSKVYSYGHRNPQGLIVSQQGVVYLHEHGPRGGDEINVVEPGVNYGWPAITYGIDYNGARVSPFTQWPGMAQPLVYWSPSVAPSGMTIYEGGLFPHWSGDLLVGTLVEKSVRRIDLEQGQVRGQEILFKELGARIRDVRSGPDGAIYLLTDDPAGQMIRVQPSP